MRRSIEGRVRPSKVPVNESSQAVYPTKTGYSSDAMSRGRNFLSGHPVNETRKPVISSVHNCHETHARDSITTHCHEICTKESYSTMIATVVRNSNKCTTDTCNTRNRTYESKCKYTNLYCTTCTI